MKKSSKEKLKTPGTSSGDEFKNIINSKEIQLLMDDSYALTNIECSIRTANCDGILRIVHSYEMPRVKLFYLWA